MKTCKNCYQIKPLEQFSWRIKAKGLRQELCKKCAAAKSRSYRSENPILIRKLNESYYGEKREKILAQKKDYYERNKERMKQQSKTRYVSIRNTPEFKLKSRDSMLRLKFGMTHNDYLRMLASQKGVCAICGNAPTEKRPLAVDHCHATGRVRGLLCNPCNSFLGRINDDVGKLEKVRQYLQ